MVGTLWLLGWSGATLLALVGALRYRRRLRAHVERPALGDDDVLRIIAYGVFVSDDDDEPLDLDQVQEEERRFWEEAEWDEAEEW